MGKVGKISMKVSEAVFCECLRAMCVCVCERASSVCALAMYVNARVRMRANKTGITLDYCARHDLREVTPDLAFGTIP